MNYYVGNQAFSSERDIYHHGVLGMKWGVRRYQNKDGSYKKGADGRYAESNTRRSAAGAGHRAMAKVYSLNEKTYNKLGNKTLASMNRNAKNQALKKAEEADKKAYAKKKTKIEEKSKRAAEKEAKLKPYKDVDPDAAKNKGTRRVALDYHNMSDQQFAGKYKTTKKTFAKRYVKTKGDTYSMGKRKAALAVAFLATQPTHYVWTGRGTRMVKVGRGAIPNVVLHDTAANFIGTNFGYKKAERKYAESKQK